GGGAGGGVGGGRGGGLGRGGFRAGGGGGGPGGGAQARLLGGRDPRAPPPRRPLGGKGGHAPPPPPVPRDHLLRRRDAAGPGQHDRSRATGHQRTALPLPVVAVGPRPASSAATPSPTAG